MAELHVQRRLAAIVVADVVGYSRLMESDEAGTLAALKERRTAILQPTVRSNGGRVVKVMGDGVLLEFASAVNAVKAALKLQEKMAEANEGLPEVRHITLRIGVNLGDVIGEGLDIYGDGVNIAARLEALAEPGGLCISANVHDEVQGKLDVAFEDAGEQLLKNLSRPVKVFRSVPGATARPSARRRPPGHDKPSIAVLPFVNMSGDREQQYFCDGITEDMITELSRFRHIHVVSRNSSSRFRGTDVDMIRAGRELGVQYLVEGSVRRMGTRTRITAQLIDATTGNHLWAERYDNAKDEIFDVQDRVVRTIVGTLAGRMSAAGAELALRKPPASLAAYEHLLRGDALPMGEPEVESQARFHFGKAIELDPEYARAYALLSYSLENEWLRDMGPSNRLRDEAFDLARKAVRLDENDALCQLAMGWAQVYRRAYELAEHHFAQALALNPNQPSVQASCAGYLTCRGEPEKAIERLLEARRLDPFFTPSWYWAELGAAYFVARRMDDAIASLRRATAMSLADQAWLAASYALGGRLDLAGDCTAALLRSVPEFSTARFVPKQSLSIADDARNLTNGLLKAGLPE